MCRLSCLLIDMFCLYVFLSRKRRLTRCTLVTRVHTCALTIFRFPVVQKIFLPYFKPFPIFNVLIMPQTQPPVTASFVVQHLDSQGKVASQEHVSCVDVSEEILSFGLSKLHELGRNPEPILLGLQSFSLERTQYGGRSEEHTSELQSLMRTSYAVFSCKKKKLKSN